MNPNGSAENTSARIHSSVGRALDVLIDAAARHDGLFPSILDRETGEMLRDLPDPLPGQKHTGRAHLGSNLVYDVPTLQALYGYTEATGDDRYERAADRYVERFATHCTDTGTGLFPWGEHAYWNLLYDRIGNSYLFECHWDPMGGAVHDHKHQVPVWLWERLDAVAPEAVQRFADGLEYHWIDDEHSVYDRHAPIEAPVRKSEFEYQGYEGDFPRHSGFYILDLAFAYQRDPREETLDQLRAFLEYHWQNRDRWDLLPITNEDDERTLGQTFSLGVSLLEAAPLLDDAEPDLAARLREYGRTYIEGYLTGPHDVDSGLVLNVCRTADLEEGRFAQNREEAGDEIEPLAPWGAVYGDDGNVMALHALLGVAAWRIDGHDAALEHATAIGEQYLATPLPEDGELTLAEANLTTYGRASEGDTIRVTAREVGLVLDLYADLYDVTGEQRWLDAGLDLADRALDLFLDAALPRAAAGVDHYESEMRPGFLLHGLLRIATLADDGTDPAGPTYVLR